MDLKDIKDLNWKYSILINGKNYLVKENIERIISWIEKSNSGADGIDKYIYTFISFNMFYNYYALLSEGPKINLEINDKKKALKPIKKLLNDHQGFFKSIEGEINDFLLSCKNFEILIDKDKKDANKLMEQLKNSNNNKKKYSEINLLIFKMLYKIRCNLIHGEKENNYYQKELLGKSSVVLIKYLVKFINELATKYSLIE